MLLRRRVEGSSTRTPCGFLALPRSPNAASGHFPSRKQPENHAERDQTYEAGVAQTLHQRHDVVGDIAKERQVGADQKRRDDRQRQQHQPNFGQ